MITSVEGLSNIIPSHPLRLKLTPRLNLLEIESIGSIPYWSMRSCSGLVDAQESHTLSPHFLLHE